MKALKTFLGSLAKDESGAALIEYSILIGIITVGVIAIIIFVGDWVSGQWSLLQSDLEAAS